MSCKRFAGAVFVALTLTVFAQPALAAVNSTSGSSTVTPHWCEIPVGCKII
jgi:hypothetical protein